jgi:uncharacterized circularly permuted ATP-grasp superfamily protein/uncharacterized alpha-E superfamily protein
MGERGGQETKSRPRRRDVAGLTGGYAPLPGIPDEFIGPDGTPRPVWAHFFDAFSELTPGEIERRFASADRHMRDAGVTYRSPGETADSPWPMSHLPLLIGQAEWKQISEGVTQRAHLLELILRDLYGPGRLIADRALPATAILGSADYLRAVCGMPPPGGQYLNLYAADIGRGPDGRWWVLSDRTQAPSGAGYALENRLVMSRALKSLYTSMNIERLAPFFESFRDHLRSISDREEPRIGLLTPGSANETYFEHTTLARYLGFLLVEGADLAVSNGRLHVRTVAGLKRLDVLLRRVDSNSLDPLELDARSTLGVPGLIDVMREGGVAVANMPGSGVAEARTLLGFLPSLSQYFLGEGLKMPSIATWWCGQAAARDEVLSRLDDMVIGGAYQPSVPGFQTGAPVIGASLSKTERERLVKAITHRGIDYVGQELVQLSTTPVWDNGHVTPRPFVLRVFATMTPNGWTVMPGGFCRIAEQPDARAVSMGEGARAADVWVVSDETVATSTLLPPGDTVRIRRIAGWVPSRAADNLFWLGRYLERAEATLRLVRALGGALRDGGKSSSATPPVIERVQRLLVTWGATSPSTRAKPATTAAQALQAVDKFGSALSLVKSAQRNAATLRERLSPDAWQVITGMVERISVKAEDEEGLIEIAEATLASLATFAGLAQENMNRAAGWRFLEIGRRVERAVNTARFARQFAFDTATGDDLDLLLTLVDSQITYRSRYLVGTLLAPVRDLVVLDPYNPRSVAFQVAALNEHIESLPALREGGLIDPPHRFAVILQSAMTAGEAEAFDTKSLFGLEQNLLNLADAIGSHYFPHGSNAARPEKLAGFA